MALLAHVCATVVNKHHVEVAEEGIAQCGLDTSMRGDTSQQKRADVLPSKVPLQRRPIEGAIAMLTDNLVTLARLHFVDDLRAPTILPMAHPASRHARSLERADAYSVLRCLTSWSTESKQSRPPRLCNAVLGSATAQGSTSSLQGAIERLARSNRRHGRSRSARR